jgi:hypothetical protein
VPSALIFVGCYWPSAKFGDGYGGEAFDHASDGFFRVRTNTLRVEKFDRAQQPSRRTLQQRNTTPKLLAVANAISSNGETPLIENGLCKGVVVVWPCLGKPDPLRFVSTRFCVSPDRDGVWMEDILQTDLECCGERIG